MFFRYCDVLWADRCRKNVHHDRIHRIIQTERHHSSGPSGGSSHCVNIFTAETVWLLHLSKYVLKKISNMVFRCFRRWRRGLRLPTLCTCPTWRSTMRPWWTCCLRCEAHHACPLGIWLWWRSRAEGFSSEVCLFIQSTVRRRPSTCCLRWVTVI